jgi:putative acetyltransferase
MEIRESFNMDYQKVMSIIRAAFDSEEEAKLVSNLLEDPSAKPYLSLLAFKENRAVGYILFTRAKLKPSAPISISLLAPLAVIPSAQRQGVGTALIQHGLQVLSDSGEDLVFVLGHTEYYPRFGFKPAGKQGFDTPYPIAEKNADAWMVLPLSPRIVDKYSGKVICADQLNKPEYWRE